MVQNIPEKLNPLSRVHARHRQTDGFAMPLDKRNVLLNTFKTRLKSARRRIAGVFTFG